MFLYEYIIKQNIHTIYKALSYVIYLLGYIRYRAHKVGGLTNDYSCMPIIQQILSKHEIHNYEGTFNF